MSFSVPYFCGCHHDSAMLVATIIWYALNYYLFIFLLLQRSVHMDVKDAWHRALAYN